MDGLKHRFPRYSRLLWLYPAGYRMQYEEQMLQTLADMLDDPGRSKASIWARTVLDLPVSAIYQQLSYEGGIMKNETPSYMKRSALLGSIMLLPFWAVVIINSLNNHSIPSSHDWELTYKLLLVGLPVIAFLLNIAAFWRWVATRHKLGTSYLKSLFDFRHNWTVLVVAGLGLLIALFVPFHDSVHCLTGNPVRELHNPHQTLQCILRG